VKPRLRDEDLSDRSFRLRNYRVDNFKSHARVSPRSLRGARAYLMRAYVVMLSTAPAGLSPVERVRGVISFGAIKGPTTLIPAGIFGPSVGIRFRHKAATLWLFVVRFADGLTLWKTATRRKRERRRGCGGRGSDGGEEKEDIRIRWRTTKCGSYADFATWRLHWMYANFLFCNVHTNAEWLSFI